MNPKFTNLLSLLLSSSIQTQIFHRQTDSLAEHMALGSYYEDIVDEIDSLTESVQGKYGIITGYSSYAYVDYQDLEQVLTYFDQLIKQFDQLRPSLAESWIQNQLDGIEELLYHTVYKLKNLA